MHSEDDEGADLSVSDELLDKLVLINHKDPAQRKTQPFVTLLEYLEAVTLGELKFMIKSCKPNSIVTAENSDYLMLVILKFIGRMCLHQRWPQLWARLLFDMDGIFAEYAATTNLALRANFVVGHAAELGAILPWDDVQSCEAALKKNEDPLVGSLQAVMSTATGAAGEKHKFVFKKQKL